MSRIASTLFSCLLLFVFSSVSFAQDSIRVMTFNIRYNNPGDGINAWPNRKEHVADMIANKHKADIAGLQEVLHGQKLDLIALLPDRYEVLGVGRGDGYQADEYSPIVFDKTKFELLQTNTFWLSETPEIPGSKSWDTAITRIVTWAKFKQKSSGKEFYFFNTHFDHRGRKAREQSAISIVKKVHEIAGDTPTIITGDFNSRETSRPYAILSGKEDLVEPASDFSDARYASMSVYEGPTATTTSWDNLNAPETKIDYIFVRKGVKVLSNKALDDRYDGRFPSDHLPVMAEVKLP